MFLVSLAVLLLGLGVFVFGVSMESMATTNGWVTADGLVEVRATRAGLVELARREAGVELSGGRVIATIHPSAWWQGAAPVVLRAPETELLWLQASLAVVPGQAVEAGQLLLTLVPLDPATRRPRRLLARLEVSEEHIIEVKVGQKVRVTSNLYNERVYPKFVAEVERIEPTAEVGRDGKRCFGVVAALETGDRPLLLGSGLKAEIVLGRKPVYRIILEH